LNFSVYKQCLQQTLNRVMQLIHGFQIHNFKTAWLWSCTASVPCFWLHSYGFSFATSRS
jgi:hypothetical protein